MGKLSPAAAKRRQQKIQRRTKERREVNRHAKHTRKIAVSRSQDIAYLESQILDLQRQRQALADKYNAYRDQVNEAIKTLQVDAGIYDEIQSLEVEREKVRAEAQSKVDEMGKQLDTLGQTRLFLLGREKVAPEAAVAEPAAEADAESAVEADAVEPLAEAVAAAAPANGNGNGTTAVPAAVPAPEVDAAPVVAPAPAKTPRPVPPTF